MGENGLESENAQAASGIVEEGEVDQIHRPDFENYTLPEDSEFIEANNQQSTDDSRDVEGIREVNKR